MPHSIATPSLVNAALVALGGVAIAAACGLRAFLPLLVLGLGARFGLVHLAPQAAWLSGDTVLWTLGVAAVLELLGDKIPVVDHALDVAGTFVRPAAAAVAGWATFAGVHPALSFAAAVVLGAGALGVHALKAKTRLGSSALTLGHANPLLSVTEDVAAGALSGLAILAPLVAFAVLALGLVLVARWMRRPRAR